MKFAFQRATGFLQDYPSNFNSVFRFHIRVFCRTGFTIALWGLALSLTRLLKARAVPARPKSIASHRNGDMERHLWIVRGEPICGEDWKCQEGSAATPAQLPAGRH